MDLDKKLFNIAIDGPSGSGKGTIAKEIARRLGFKCLDTGSMYRALALQMKRKNIEIGDFKKEYLEDIHIDFNKENNVLLNGEDVSNLIRTSEIGKLASDFSTLKPFREFLVKEQQEIVKVGGYVAEGRDIGSVVISNAKLKIYLTASLDERARRRLKDYEVKGVIKNFNEVYDELRLRDKQDTEREIGPLIKCTDAIEIDNSNLSVDEQVERILDLIDNIDKYS